MLKKVIVTALILTQVAGVQFASAQGTETQTTNEVTKETIEAGITPDNFMYFLDGLVEKIQLALTFDDEEKTLLMMDFAKERLAEAKEMQESGNTDLVEQLISKYSEQLLEISKSVDELTLNTEDQDKVDEIIGDLDQVVTDSDEITEELPEDVVKDLEEVKENAYLGASVVNNFEKEQVITLKEKGYGLGQIAKLLTFSKLSGKTIDEVVTLFEQTKDYKQLGEALGVSYSQVRQELYTHKHEKISAKLEEKEDADEDDIDQMDRLEDKVVTTESSTEIEKITSEIKAKYGDNLTEEQERAMQKEIAAAKKTYIDSVKEEKKTKEDIELQNLLGAEKYQELQNKIAEIKQSYGTISTESKQRELDKKIKETIREFVKDFKETLKENQESDDDKYSDDHDSDDDKYSDDDKKSEDKESEKDKKDNEKQSEKDKKDYEKQSEKDKKDREKQREQDKKDREKQREQDKKDRENQREHKEDERD